jgi:hypothetical protein
MSGGRHGGTAPNVACTSKLGGGRALSLPDAEQPAIRAAQSSRPESGSNPWTSLGQHRRARGLLPQEVHSVHCGRSSAEQWAVASGHSPLTHLWHAAQCWTLYRLTHSSVDSVTSPSLTGTSD